jgi:hypothetical protein
MNDHACHYRFLLTYVALVTTALLILEVVRGVWQ